MSEAKQEVKRMETQEITDQTSANVFVVMKLTSGQMASMQYSMRHGLSAEEIMDDFGEKYKALDKIALNYGTDVLFWDGKTFNGYVSPFTPSQPSGAPAASQPPAPSNGNGSEHKNEFPCGLLQVEFKNKKAYYTVSGVEGAKFPKFPVRVWDEVLEAAGIPTQFSMDEVKDGKSLMGWTAVYEKDENGKVKKVIELRKPDFAE